MKKTIVILFTVFITACGPIYRSTHKKTIRKNDDGITELTSLINKNDRNTFLSMLKADSTYVSFDTKDSLGFNYFRREKRLCLSKEICFNVQLISHFDSLITVSVSPSFAKVRSSTFKHYKSSFEKQGWIFNKEQYFENKYFDFKASTVAINEPGLKQKNISPYLDSLMSPFYIVNDGDYLAKLSGDELYYLMHSISPQSRAGALKQIKCGEAIIKPEVETWIEITKRNSPFMMATAYMGGRLVSFGYHPIDYFIRCNKK